MRQSDYHEGYFIGGAKTEAGKNRIVTISPKIYDMVKKYAAENNEYVFSNNQGKKLSEEQFRSNFYNIVESIGISNDNHNYTPHCCRHTFATLMKRVQGADRDKMALIGHSSEEMLRYYQDTNINDLKKITDKI